MNSEAIEDAVKAVSKKHVEKKRSEAPDRERESLGEVPQEAAETLLERGSHGDAIENHEHIAALWSAYLGVEVSAREVAEMCILLKLSRALCGEPVRDHYVDICGYAAIAEFIEREGGSS